VTYSSVLGKDVEDGEDELSEEVDDQEEEDENNLG